MLNIRNPRAAALARALAEKRRITMTDAVIEALSNELAREAETTPLKSRLGAIIDDFIRPERIVGRDLTKDEIDAMWGD
ncbi:type II toxin-antitoxin system VapB family antitoxin [Phenylobacterium montanum]|uniref:Type II toxin-antitoxin system VapB family antitoxin n=1 Tax=Phenylobacterium montanum TaxID=2823693 RepID=A0A975IWC2_9CAUL|nr:type II toxin-antitoxin system VapB family antitoxin [Caulobacter sp. S6]QUD89927.1 type II toxin-antitoxin system VapB family antitoxin [Caulobacter sp. S6]